MAAASPLVRTLLRLTAGLHARSPFLATLLPTVGLAYGIQGAVAVPSILAQSERFYDASGSLTYLSCTALSLALPALRAKYGVAGDGVGVVAKGAQKWPGFTAAVRLALRTGAIPGGVWNWRMLLLSAAVSVWAIRLGSFLLNRILKDGRDSRFDKMRYEPGKFGVAFFAQATWVSLVLLPVISVNSLPAAVTTATAGIGAADVLGIALFLGGFVTEAVADRQKSQWAAARAEKKHSEQFLTHGLWGRSRHPNYFGEITLWVGIATAAAGTLASPAGLKGIGLAPNSILSSLIATGLAAASPAFTAFLLTKVSGIPLSEKKYDKRFKGNKAYEQWKRDTPMLIPKLFK